ncbi:hypothetical protein [Defluviitalea phaphyphila]|uniref:hypothetical protein n=1 Tax=Defluviitalea phaphyphila TaxID=1473580 RepID=UPI0013BEA7D5|nr:hypothetical protein [Defluviitalea phaphyphila]
MECPICHNKKLGVLGKIRYYCPICNVEIVLKHDKLEIYEIKEDGELILIKNKKKAS